MKRITTFFLLAILFLSACASNQEAMEAYYAAIATRTNSPMMVLKGTAEKPAVVSGTEIRIYFPLDEVNQFQAPPSELLQGIQAASPWLGIGAATYFTSRQQVPQAQVVHPTVVQQPAPIIIQP